MPDARMAEIARAVGLDGRVPDLARPGRVHHFRDGEEFFDDVVLVKHLFPLLCGWFQEFHCTQRPHILKDPYSVLSVRVAVEDPAASWPRHLHRCWIFAIVLVALHASVCCSVCCPPSDCSMCAFSFP